MKDEALEKLNTQEEVINQLIKDNRELQERQAAIETNVLDKKNKSLLRINADLDHFVHTTSHDLFSSIRQYRSEHK